MCGETLSSKPWLSLKHLFIPSNTVFFSVQVTVDLVIDKGLRIALGSNLPRNISFMSCGLWTIEYVLYCLPLRFTNAILGPVCIWLLGKLENGARSVCNYEFKILWMRLSSCGVNGYLHIYLDIRVVSYPYFLTITMSVICTNI